MLEPLVDAAAYVTCMCGVQYDHLHILSMQSCLHFGLLHTGSVPNGRGPELDKIKRQAQMHLQKSLASHHHQQYGPAGAWPTARHASPLGGGSAAGQSTAYLLSTSELPLQSACLCTACLFP